MIDNLITSDDKLEIQMILKLLFIFSKDIGEEKVCT